MYPLIKNVKIEGFVTFFTGHQQSLYKLSIYTEDFKLLGFPPCIRDFVFFYEISHVLETFEFLQTFLPILGFFIFTDFPLHWGLYVFTIPSCAEDFAFYEISYVPETLNFYKLLPCTEDFVNVCEFPPVLGTLNFYDFLLY